MTTRRLLAIAAIFILSSVAWATLGASIVARSGEFDARLSQQVAQLWGGEHRQAAPAVCVERSHEVTESVVETVDGHAVTREVTRQVARCHPLTLARSRVAADLRLAHRQKGLLWYDTYGVTFDGRYSVGNPDDVARVLCVRVPFPAAEALYDRFTFRVNGQSGEPLEDLAQGMQSRITVPAGGEALIELAYDSRGLDRWSYAFASQGVAEVNDFELVMNTDFADVDFPAGTISPSEKRKTSDGWRLTWRFDSLVTGQQVGMDLPNKLNPGPLAARITAFAPVSLLFFLVVMVIIGVLHHQNLHPINYAFLSAAFFAFHLLMAYLVDHVSLHAAFAASAVVSVFLVVSYLRLVAGTRFAVVKAGVAQIVFLVLFSYAFFFEGFTGLTVTIGAIVTLFVLMQATASVDWATVMAGEKAGSVPHGDAIGSEAGS
jgi:inner membrane protein involved in colicin E2 resistance